MIKAIRKVDEAVGKLGGGSIERQGRIIRSYTNPYSKDPRVRIAKKDSFGLWERIRNNFLRG